jgi:hypothetical protein
VLLFVGTADLDPVPDLILLGEAAGDEFGSSLATTPDLDGDGAHDVLVGAPLANSPAGVDIGKAYFFRAGAALDDLADLTWTGESSEDRFGKAVAGGFDWNDDGAADCAVGAYTSDHNADQDAGACFVFAGGALLDGVADTVLTGSGPDAGLGWAVASGGDVRANGRGTLLVSGFSASDPGWVELFGSQQAPTAVTTSLPGQPARLLNPWPNPFNPRVQTSLELAGTGSWRVAVYDLRGREVALLQQGSLGPGKHTLVWDGTGSRGSPQPSGRYVIRAQSANGSLAAPITLVR